MSIWSSLARYGPYNHTNISKFYQQFILEKLNHRLLNQILLILKIAVLIFLNKSEFEDGSIFHGF